MIALHPAASSIIGKHDVRQTGTFVRYAPTCDAHITRRLYTHTLLLYSSTHNGFVNPFPAKVTYM
jgi:hypothetical protein